jgi:peroxiredoxin
MRLKILIPTLACMSFVAGLFGGEITMDKSVYSSAAEAEPLRVGDRVPDGILFQMDGKEVHLSKLIASKPSVLIFYRGGWCPFCNLQMGQLVALEPELAKMGYQILGITPDSTASLKASLEKHKINYTLLSDASMELTRDFGLAYHMGDAMVAKLKEYGNDIEASTGNRLHELPVPAAFVVDTHGKIHFVYSNPDFKVRVDPEALKQAAEKALKG